MDQSLESALYSAVHDIHNLLLNSKETIDNSITMEKHWVKMDGNDDFYMTENKYIVLWPYAYQRLNMKLKQLKSREDAKKKFEADPLFGSQLNKIVGAEHLSGNRIEFDDILYRTISPFFGQKELLEFDSKKLTEKIHSIYQDFVSNEIVLEEIIPLFGFKAEQNEIIIDVDLRIVKLEQSEISNLLDAGIPIALYTPQSNFAGEVFEYSIVRKRKFRKVVGPQSPFTENEKEPKISWVNNIIYSMQLFKEGTIVPVAKVFRGKSIFWSGYILSEHFSRPIYDSTYILKTGEEARIVDHWQKLLNISQRIPNYLHIALSRYSQARVKKTYEDKIIDLMIAAEAIYLQSETDLNGELSYRLSHRAALLLGKDKKEQKEIFTFFKKAYDVRSKVVHGSTLVIKKGQMSLDDIVNSLTKYISASIVKILDMLINTNQSSFKVDWNEIIFSE
ncbi:HEPN domain-containing protein [Leptospira licerasiae]|uniref:HEPN domain-containing protein n=1 Tax=Leptospira licerasiae TaxID=447106 RepID=UPI0010833BE6|nr:HEPN domain-containing protein [Leptospira licerasiae]TGM87898.1 hypothetical protein EHR05_14680 [Leptospira licerasiae]